MGCDPEEPQQPVEYISHEEFARRRASRLIRKNPPPTRDPDLIQLPSNEQTAEIEVTGPGPEGQRQRVSVRLRGPRQPSYMGMHLRAIEESNEKTLFAVALISLFVPFGFLLAIWPAVASKGAGRAVALICIFIHVALFILLLAPLMRSE